MKGKIIMLITIGIICILLTGVMFVQFKSVQVIEESGVGAMRESELREEYSEIREKTEEMKDSLEEINKSIEQYNNESTDNQGTIELLKSDLEKANCNLGYTDVKGPGLTITLSDGNASSWKEDAMVNYFNLLFVVNELKYAGAEAISINDERVINTTDIFNIEGRFLMINGQRITSPYIIKVIGDTNYLQSVINIKGGIKDEMINNGKNIYYTVDDEVYIKKSEELIEINYGE